MQFRVNEYDVCRVRKDKFLKFIIDRIDAVYYEEEIFEKFLRIYKNLRAHHFSTIFYRPFSRSSSTHPPSPYRPAPLLPQRLVVRREKRIFR